MCKCKKVMTRRQGLFCFYVFIVVYGGAALGGLFYILFLKG